MGRRKGVTLETTVGDPFPCVPRVVVTQGAGALECGALGVLSLRPCSRQPLGPQPQVTGDAEVGQTARTCGGAGKASRTVVQG